MKQARAILIQKNAKEIWDKYHEVVSQNIPENFEGMEVEVIQQMLFKFDDDVLFGSLPDLVEALNYELENEYFYPWKNADSEHDRTQDEALTFGD